LDLPSFLPIAAILFFAILTQSITGFGLALIAMPLLITILDPITAGALMALVGLPLQFIILRRYRHALQFHAVWRTMIGAAIGVPIGIIALTRLDESIILTGLGIILVSYALYSLARLKLPTIERQSWGVGFGIVSGMLSGAFNTGGPPLAIYGACRQWQPDVFKANMQLLLMFNSLMVAGAHLLSGHMTPTVWGYFALVAIPLLLIATTLGFKISTRVDERLFRDLILVLLLLIGVRLLL